MKKSIRVILTVFLVLVVTAGAVIFVTMRQLDITRVDDYLYVANCGHIDIKLADRILSFVNADVEVACTSVRKGNLHARNFDWYYSEEAEFIVRCGGHGEKYDSIGVASLSGVTDKQAAKGVYIPVYHLLSLYTVDGINEAGLTVNTNIVPQGDTSPTTGTNPGGMRLCSMIIPRYLLDNAGSVDEAVELLKAADIYSYVDESGPFELHFMISDREKTAVVEFIDNELIVLKDEYIMTNFYLAMEGYTEHAMGIERYDILKARYDSLTDEDSMFRLMEDVWYSRAYTETDPAWLSEDYGTVVNDNGQVFGLSSDPDDFVQVLEEEQARFLTRSRIKGDTWHTTHTSLYDMDKLTLSIIPQESGIVYRFGFDD